MKTDKLPPIPPEHPRFKITNGVIYFFDWTLDEFDVIKYKFCPITGLNEYDMQDAAAHAFTGWMLEFERRTKMAVESDSKSEEAGLNIKEAIDAKDKADEWLEVYRDFMKGSES